MHGIASGKKRARGGDTYQKGCCEGDPAFTHPVEDIDVDAILDEQGDQLVAQHVVEVGVVEERDGVYVKERVAHAAMPSRVASRRPGPRFSDRAMQPASRACKKECIFCRRAAFLIAGFRIRTKWIGAFFTYVRHSDLLRHS